jgi:hypothetical protein
MPSAPRCNVPDIVEEGQTKRWCKQCDSFLDVDLFGKKSHGGRERLCRKHATERMRGAYRAMADASIFCKQTGTECKLTIDDVRVLEAEHDLQVLRLVPTDPALPLGLENVCAVAPRVRRTLASLLRRKKDLKYYRKVLSHEFQSKDAGVPLQEAVTQPIV